MRKNTVRFLRLLPLLLTVVLCFGCISGGLTAQAAENWKSNVMTNDIVDAFGLKRTQVRSVTFLDSLEDVPANAWNMGKGASARVKGWLQWDGSLADVYLAAEGGMNGKDCAKNLFQDCVNLEEVSFGGAFHTEEVTSLEGMFDGCKKLTAVDVETLNTAKVKSVQNMFHDCSSLEELDISTWDTSSLIHMKDMFAGCTALKKPKGAPELVRNPDIGQIWPIAGNVVDIRIVRDVLAVHYTDRTVHFYNLEEFYNSKKDGEICKPIHSWDNVRRLWDKWEEDNDPDEGMFYLHDKSNYVPSYRISCAEESSWLYGLREDGSVAVFENVDSDVDSNDYTDFVQEISSWKNVTGLYQDRVNDWYLIGYQADGTLEFASKHGVNEEMETKIGQWENVCQFYRNECDYINYGLHYDGTVSTFQNCYRSRYNSLDDWTDIVYLTQLPGSGFMLGKKEDGSWITKSSIIEGDSSIIWKDIERIFDIRRGDAGCLIGCTKDDEMRCMCKYVTSEERIKHEEMFRDWGDVVWFRDLTKFGLYALIGFTKDGEIRIINFDETNDSLYISDYGISSSALSWKKANIELNFNNLCGVKDVQLIDDGMIVLFEDGYVKQLGVRAPLDTSKWGKLDEISSLVGGKVFLVRKDGTALIQPLTNSENFNELSVEMEFGSNKKICQIRYGRYGNDFAACLFEDGSIDVIDIRNVDS